MKRRHVVGIGICVGVSVIATIIIIRGISISKTESKSEVLYDAPESVIDDTLSDEYQIEYDGRTIFKPIDIDPNKSE